MKRFAVLVPSERHAESWNREYAAMFQMLGGVYHRQRRIWRMASGEEIRICVIRGPKDVDQMQGIDWIGFSRESIYDPEVIDSIMPLIRP